jgi:hypothetical protein
MTEAMEVNLLMRELSGPADERVRYSDALAELAELVYSPAKHHTTPIIEIRKKQAQL